MDSCKCTHYGDRGQAHGTDVVCMYVRIFWSVGLLLETWSFGNSFVAI